MKVEKYSKDADVRIVVVRDRFVLVGVYVRDEKRGIVTLVNSYIIRQWGTDKGLAQLAIEGVRSETVLDYGGDVEIPWHAVIYTVHCVHSSWRK